MPTARLTLAELTDPGRFTVAEASTLAAAMAIENGRLPERLADLLKIDPPPDYGRAERILELLGRITKFDRLAPLLDELTCSPNVRIRSKACKLYAGAGENLVWATERLDHPDARLAANGVEALWNAENSEALQAVFWRGARQPRNRVAGNGMVGLFLCEHPRAGELALAMADDSSADFRATAAWAMGKAPWLPGMNNLKSLTMDTHGKFP